MKYQIMPKEDMSADIISFIGERGDYIGFGLGAASLIKGVRYKNTENIETYIKKAGKESIVCEQEILTKKRLYV